MRTWGGFVLRAIAIVVMVYGFAWYLWHGPWPP